MAASLIALVALRALMGATQAPFFPATGGAPTCNWFPVTGWAFPSSLGNAGLTLGAAATGPLIAWLMLRFGWRASFALTAPLAVLLAAVWWWYVRDAPAQHRAVSPAELAPHRPRPPREPLRAAAAGHGEADAPGSADPPAVRELLLQQLRLLLFFNWLFVYLIENRGMKVLERGFYASAPWIAGAIGALLGGGLCDRLSRSVGKRLAHRWVALVSVAVSGLLLVAAAEASAPLLAVALLALCLGFQQASDAVYWSAAISVSGNHSSSACGVMNTAGNVVGGVGALLVPLTVRALGWPAALATGTAFATVGALLWCWIRADREFPEPAA